MKKIKRKLQKKELFDEMFDFECQEIDPASFGEGFQKWVEGMEQKERPSVEGCLKTGEIARIRSRFNFFPEVVCRVTMATTDFVHFAVGDIRMSCPSDTIEVLEHNHPAPFFWEEEEIKLLRAHAEDYNCPDCKKTLHEKEAKLRSLQV